MLARADGFAKEAGLDAAGLMARSRKRQLLGFSLDAIAGDLERGGRYVKPNARPRPSFNVQRIRRVEGKAFAKSLRDRGAAEMMQAQ